MGKMIPAVTENRPRNWQNLFEIASVNMVVCKIWLKMPFLAPEPSLGPLNSTIIALICVKLVLKLK